MAAPNIQILDEALAPLAAVPTFDVLPGARSNVVTLHVVNNPEGADADTAHDLALRVMERSSGETVWNASGRPLVDGRRIEARITTGVGGLVVDPTPWEPIGAGRTLALPALGNAEGVRLEVSIVAPIDVQGDAVELYLGIRATGVTVLGQGLTETHGDGVALGLGDGTVTQLVHGGSVNANVPADEHVVVGDAGWIAAGVPWVQLESTFQLDDLDGAGAVLEPGRGYWALIILGSDGAVSAVKSSQGDLPIDDVDRPTAPAGAVPLAMVTRDDGGVVDAADIESLSTVGAAALTFDGLAATLGPSAGLVDNRWWRRDRPESVTLPPSSTCELWRLPSGDVALTTDGTRPDPRALLLHEVDTGPSAVVEHRPRLRYLGRREVVRFVFEGPLTVGAVAHADWPVDRPGFVAPMPGQIMATVFDLAGTTDATVWDLEFAEPAAPAAWTSIVPNRPPALPWDATTRATVEALPEVTVTPPRALLRCRVIAQTVTTQPSGAVVSLTVHQP